MEDFESRKEVVNPRETDFLRLAKYLKSAIQKIDAGDIEGSKEEITLVLLKMNYNVRYAPFMEIPEEMIIHMDSYESDDPVFNEISEKITNIAVIDSMIEDTIEHMNNVEKEMDEHLNQLEEMKKLTSVPVDESKKILQQKIDEMKQERNKRRVEINNTLKKHPEFMEKLQSRIDELDSTQENPE
jgi:DNA repair ATPase RecN